MKDDGKKILIQCGIDYDEGVEKFMNEEELYQGLLVNFLTDNTFDEARRCIKADDLNGAEKAVHAMKSVTGTLSMNALYRMCSETIDALRDGNLSRAQSCFEKAYNMYLEISRGIKTFLSL